MYRAKWGAEKATPRLTAPIKKTNLAKLECGERRRNCRNVKIWSGDTRNSGSSYLESQRTEPSLAMNAAEKMTKKPASGILVFSKRYRISPARERDIKVLIPANLLR